MTTQNDDYQDRIRRFGKGFTDGQGKSKTAFGDASGQYPRTKNWYQSSINEAARGGEGQELTIGGATKGIDLDIGERASSQYGMADVRETASGHVIELNDTPAGERILFKHKTGAGIEMRPDGSVLVVTSRNKVEVTHGDNTVIVEGEANLTYKGNLNLNVTGDFNVNCRDYNVHARGSKTEQIDNNSKTSVFGNYGNSVSGSFLQSVAGNTTNLTLGTQTLVTKGDLVVATEGSQEIVSKGRSIFTSEEQINLSSPDINIVATDIAVAGNRGTIGGGTTVHYGSSFHGNLKGTADHAVTAGSLGGGASISIYNSVGDLLVDGSGGGGSGSGSITHTSTANPTEGMTNSYLTVGDRGIRKIHIDVNDYLKNQLLLRDFSIEDVRSKMREKSIRDMAEFTAHQVSKNKLNSSFAQTSPGSYGRIRSTSAPQPQRPVNPIGEIKGITRVQTFKTTRGKAKYDIIPPAEYLTNINGAITPKTQINYGTSMGKFIGGNDTGDFNKVDDKNQLAKNYFIHSELIKTVTSSGPHPTAFENYRLEVVEGFYAKELYGIGAPGKLEDETLTGDGILDLRTKGRAVVYELVDKEGKIDLDATYDLAAAWAEVGYFDKLTLDYDVYDPSGVLNAQLIVETPNITSFNDILFKRKITTTFNNTVQSNDALVEIKL